MQTILVTGGTGLIGKTLIPFLNSSGYKVIVLTRTPENYTSSDLVSYAQWDTKKQTIDVAAVQQADFIIHLAGAGVVDKKWTKEYKDIILKSRTESSGLLVKTLQENKNEVKAIISASAIGYYGADRLPGKAFTEDDAPAKDFLGDTCVLWEKSILKAEALNIRVCLIRTGIVLAEGGGALPEFVKTLKFGIASVLGSGKQIVSWIHVQDHCRIILQALEHTNMSGPYNSVAPQPVSNKDLVVAAAKIKKGSFYITMNVPAFVLKLMLGERSTEVLKSTTVSASKIREAGYNFVYPTINAALQQLLS